MCSCVMRIPSRSSSVRESAASDCVMRRQEMPASIRIWVFSWQTSDAFQALELATV